MRILRTPLAVLALVLLAAACGGGGGGGGGTTAPFNIVYPVTVMVQRAGEAFADNTPTAQGDPVDTWTIAPPLPAGMGIDAGTGTISGTPLAETASANYTVTATNAGGSGQAVVEVAIGKPLPSAFSTLAAGFEVEEVVQTPDVTNVAKMALAPDGRLFFIEVGTGWIRMFDTQFGLKTAAYVDLSTLTIGATNLELVTGSHRGLVGLCLDPDFTNNGYLYVMLSVQEVTTGNNPRNVVLRFTDSPGVANDPQDDVGTNQALVLDGLPIAPTNNGGELFFDNAGTHLFVSTGDAEVSTDAQNGGSLAGKILRMLPTTPATVPGVPDPNPSGTFEWARGVRNCYAAVFHPTNDNLFFGDNEGTDASTMESMLDEINFIPAAPGNVRNFRWGANGGMVANGGTRIWESIDAETPSALAWHTGPGFSTPSTDSLLMATYTTERMYQFVMEGPVRADIFQINTFATFGGGPGEQPIDIVVDDATGEIYLSLLRGIYCVSPVPTLP